MLGPIWFTCFLFLFALKTGNDQKNIFGCSFENIFPENIFKTKAEYENEKK